MCNTPSVPTVPDPSSVAAQQQQYNVQDANLQQQYNTQQVQQQAQYSGEGAAIQQGLNTATAQQQYGYNTQTAAQQALLNALTGQQQFGTNIQTAGAQQGYNVGDSTAAQAASNYNSYDPYGSITYQQTGVGPGGVPTYSASQNLSAPEQNIFNQLQGSQGSAATAANSLISPSTYSGTPDLAGDTSSITNQVLGQEESYLNPYFTQQSQQLDNQLRNQGIEPGTPAYNQQMMALQQNQNGSISQFLASAEPQAFSQAESQYELPLQTAQALQQYATGNINPVQQQLTGAGLNLSAPTVANTNITPTTIGGTTVAPTTYSVPQVAQTTIQPPNYEGDVTSANTANMAAYQAQLAQQGSILSGLFGGIGTAVGGLAKSGAICDKDLKEDFENLDAEEVLEAIADLEVMDFAYTPEAHELYTLPERRTAPMAQQYAEKFRGDGRTIDIVDMMGKMLLAIQALERRTRNLK